MNRYLTATALMIVWAASSSVAAAEGVEHLVAEGVCVCAAAALAEAEADLERVLPKLFDAFVERNSYGSGIAGESFKRLKPTAIPYLTAALEDERPDARAVAALALFHLGPKAKAAVPAFLTLLDDSDQTVNNRAARALKSIDPEAAKTAGVKCVASGVRRISGQCADPRARPTEHRDLRG
jgi:HEAT repeat protein